MSTITWTILIAFLYGLTILGGIAYVGGIRKLGVWGLLFTLGISIAGVWFFWTGFSSPLFTATPQAYQAIFDFERTPELVGAARNVVIFYPFAAWVLIIAKFIVRRDEIRQGLVRV